MASTFGTLFRVTTWGESHGGGVGVVVDGCPPNLEFDLGFVQSELDRRKPGQSSLVSQRKESDTVECLSGIYEGKTLGSPICLWVRNEDARGKDYDEMRAKFRPSHADFAYEQKYGIRAIEGGGRASARETVGRVAAGAIAKLLLRRFGVEVIAFVEQVHHLKANVNVDLIKLEDVEATPIRCPDPEVAQAMIRLIEGVRKDGDSVGGVVACVCRGVPAGWGEPIFDKLDADLGKAMLSLPACKGFEVGSGFGGVLLRGSEHNDPFRSNFGGSPPAVTTSNFSGGIQGGISNGMPIVMRAAFKPTSTIMREQETVTSDYENTTLTGRGRHDPCVLPRAVVIVEAMAAIVLVDHWLRQAALTRC